MKKIWSRPLTLLAAPLLALALFLSLAARPAAAGTYTNPIVTGAADPFITYQNGTYYLLSTSLSNDIRIWSSPSLATLGSGAPASVYNTGGFYESAELYTFNGLWYIYYTQYPNSIIVLESDSSNPLGSYHFKAQLTNNTYDGTLLQMPGGQLYLLGSTYGTVVIQPLSNPYTVSGGQSTLIRMDQGWESGVIEAPEALWHNGQLNIIYSSGGYNQSNYAVGSLHFNGGDPTNPGSYSKLPGPLFTGNPGAGVNDAGVASPFSSPDGTQTYFCYSDYPSQGAPDSQRSILAQSLSFDGNNNPVFGSAIGPGQAIALPSGDPGNGGGPINTGLYYRLVNQNSGKVAAVNGASASAGAQLTQWDDNGTPDHNWKFVPLGNGTYHIVNQNSGLLMAVTGASTADSANLTQWTDNGTPDHNWTLTPVGNGTYHIVNQNSQELLAVNSASTADGANLQQYHDNGSADHNWQLVPVSGSSTGGIVSGAYYSLTNVSSGFALDDPNGSNQAATLLALWTVNNATPQNWQFNRQSDGSYTLTNQAAGLNLDDPNGSSTAGQHLQLWPANGATAQNWQAILRPDGAYTFTNEASGLSLDDPNGAGPAGTLVQLWPTNGATAQEWSLTRH